MGRKGQWCLMCLWAEKKSKLYVSLSVEEERIWFYSREGKLKSCLCGWKRRVSLMFLWVQKRKDLGFMCERAKGKNHMVFWVESTSLVWRFHDCRRAVEFGTSLTEEEERLNFHMWVGKIKCLMSLQVEKEEGFSFLCGWEGSSYMTSWMKNRSIIWYFCACSRRRSFPRVGKRTIYCISLDGKSMNWVCFLRVLGGREVILFSLWVKTRTELNFFLSGAET